LLAIIWGFGAAVVIAVLPIVESSDAINKVVLSLKNWMFGHLDEELDMNKGKEPEEFNALRTAADDTFEESHSDSAGGRVSKIAV
jgi:hypothetical protein